jgi:hypothetical protein
MTVLIKTIAKYHICPTNVIFGSATTLMPYFSLRLTFFCESRGSKIKP